jgi:hypothetical protein
MLSNWPALALTNRIHRHVLRKPSSPMQPDPVARTTSPALLAATGRERTVIQRRGGLEVARQAKSPAQIVFITAHDDFALEASMLVLSTTC